MVGDGAAAHRLLVDFHGAYKPEGMRRTLPNLISREGVMGSERNTWTDTVTPRHNVTPPFTRMAVGPMDYTPGAVRHANPVDFRPVFNRPMSQGTRSHQVALYVAYESPLQMLADSPSNCRKEAETLSFIAGIPTTWCETVPLPVQWGSMWRSLAGVETPGMWVR